MKSKCLTSPPSTLSSAHDAPVAWILSSLKQGKWVVLSEPSHLLFLLLQVLFPLISTHLPLIRVSGQVSA